MEDNKLVFEENIVCLKKKKKRFIKLRHILREINYRSLHQTNKKKAYIPKASYPCGNFIDIPNRHIISISKRK